MMARLLIFMTRAVSAFFRALGWRACRFHPTCSEYAVQAFGTLSWYRALAVAARRLLRCHPGSAGGYDPLRTDGTRVLRKVD